MSPEEISYNAGHFTAVFQAGGLFPITRNTTAIMRNSTNRIHAIFDAAPATPVNPSNPAIIAIIKKVTVHPSIRSSLR
jgi:hypothetical protein